ncbi:MAG: hypothetical protein QOE88_670, partial [Verrucomicrobiota bacterium]|nr:hypothetical protein [Verrucomicrobiota bacterium]
MFDSLNMARAPRFVVCLPIRRINPQFKKNILFAAICRNILIQPWLANFPRPISHG